MLYGLPKVHKDNCPARPILSAIGTYNYNLAKFFVPLLKPLTTNLYTVTDSFSFVKEISSFPNNSFYMASFDVTSLFTNVPLDEVIDICTNVMFADDNIVNYNGCKFDRSNFKKLLSFAVKDNHFLFNGVLYDQIDGVAMGSPLGPTLANIFMCSLEQRYLSNCPSQFKPLLYRRYVDDTFCLFKDKNDIDLFLNYINGIHSNINFTVEVENCSSLPFLDILVEKSNDCFNTSLFRKKTFTGLYTDFASLSPNWFKTNLINSLLYRAFNICSSYANFHNEIVRIKCILAKNCFPRSMVDNVIRSFLDKQYILGNKRFTDDGKKTSIAFCLPFLGSYSTRIKKNVIKLFKDNYPDIKLQVIFRSPARLSSFFRIKDRFPYLLCSNVIYKYTCSSCNATYYGKTIRNLKVRCLEHLGRNRSGQKTNSSNPSSIGEHIGKTGHNATMEDFKIIAKCNNAFDLLIYESLLIQKDRPSLNSQQSSIPLVLF